MRLSILWITRFVWYLMIISKFTVRVGTQKKCREMMERRIVRHDSLYDPWLIHTTYDPWLIHTTCDSLYDPWIIHTTCDPWLIHTTCDSFIQHMYDPRLIPTIWYPWLIHTTHDSCNQDTNFIRDTHHETAYTIHDSTHLVLDLLDLLDLLNSEITRFLVRVGPKIFLAE